MSRDISLVLPVDNRASLVSEYLDSLLESLPASIDFEVVVVDPSANAAPTRMTTDGDRVRVVAGGAESGWATACNAGAAIASGEWLVFLSVEISPRAHWLDALLTYARRYPQAAVVGSKLLFANNSVLHAGVVICQDHYPRNLYTGFPEDHPAVNKSRRFQIVASHGALIRRESFEYVGGFDATFRNGYEDVDLCLRLGEQGGEIYFCHRSALYLVDPAPEPTFARDDDTSRLYWRQWAHRVHPDDLRYYLEDGLLSVSYSDSHPVQLTISPLLAPAGGREREPLAERLPYGRSGQVGDLLKDLIRLTMRSGDTELRMTERLEALAARIELLANREEELRGMLMETRTQLVRRDDELSAALESVQAALAARQQALNTADSTLGYRHQKLIHRVSYQQLTDRIREIAQITLPQDATVVVVSKGDDDLLNLDGRRGWHFPQTDDGQYAGAYPADSAEAIAHLETLRARGAGYILFPNTAFWWLGYYGDFHRHLDDRYQRIWNDGSGIIYRLEDVAEQPAKGSASAANGAARQVTQQAYSTV